MYCKDFRCTYLEKDSLETYQQELLMAFQCDTIDTLIPSIEAFYPIAQSDELTILLQKIMKLTNVNEEFSFYILFSYDYFSYMHDYLIDPSTFTLLYDKIKV